MKGQIEVAAPASIEQAAKILPAESLLNGPPPLESLLSVHDFQKVAGETFTKKTFAFYSSAATDLVTQKENHEVWRKLLLRPRVLRNVKDVCIKRRILGCESDASFFVSPAAMAKLAHSDGELAIARGCGVENIIQIVGDVPVNGLTIADPSRSPATHRILYLILSRLVEITNLSFFNFMLIPRGTRPKNFCEG